MSPIQRVPSRAEVSALLSSPNRPESIQVVGSTSDLTTIKQRATVPPDVQGILPRKERASVKARVGVAHADRPGRSSLSPVLGAIDALSGHFVSGCTTWYHARTHCSVGEIDIIRLEIDVPKLVLQWRTRRASADE